MLNSAQYRIGINLCDFDLTMKFVFHNPTGGIHSGISIQHFPYLEQVYWK